MRRMRSASLQCLYSPRPQCQYYPNWQKLQVQHPILHEHSREIRACERDAGASCRRVQPANTEHRILLRGRLPSRPAARNCAWVWVSSVETRRRGRERAPGEVAARPADNGGGGERACATWVGVLGLFQKTGGPAGAVGRVQLFHRR